MKTLEDISKQLKEIKNTQKVIALRLKLMDEEFQIRLEDLKTVVEQTRKILNNE